MTSSQTVGSADNPLHVAIIGSGPSGFYAADALLKADLETRVDVFDRLPVPFGLVRYGVAPDHQNIKAVIKAYEKTAAHPDFRFFGNVNFGSDLRLDDLRNHYHQIVFAVGCESDRSLGIPGEDLEGSYSATEFVAWYNGHPDYAGRQFELGHTRVAVIGVGNVAMDVTRVLLKDRDALAATDMTDEAVAALRQAGVREVLVLGRRGPAQAAFSPKEIKEIAELDGVDVIVRQQDMDSLALDEIEQLERDARKNVDFLLDRLAEGPSGADRQAQLLFLASPRELIGTDGKVSAIVIERNRLETDESGRQRAVATGETETFDVGAVFRSIGYNGIPLPDVPFNDAWGIISNVDGRVTDAESGDAVPGLYAVGWIKRGPSGLVGTNKADSNATVQLMLEDLPTIAGPEQPGDIAALLADRGVQAVSFDDWKQLDQQELDNGQAAGKVRRKFATVAEMMAALGR